MSKLFHVETEFGTVLQAREDGQIVHASIDHPGLSRLAAQSDENANPVLFLRAGVHTAGLRIDGVSLPPQAMLTFLASEQLNGVTLRLPLSGEAVVAGPIEDRGYGAIVVDGARESGTVFRNRRATSSSASGLASIPRFDVAGATELLVAARPDSLLLAAAMLRVLPIHEVREAWSVVRNRHFHDALFGVVQERGREALGTFPGYTSAVLRTGIEQHGWSIGSRTYGHPRIIEAGRGRLTIGRFCSMADPTIVLGNHQTQAASTYPFMDLWAEWPGTRVGLVDHVARDVVIGSDVWIGVNAIILPGAVIGDGALIGAGAVVRGAIPPYGICTGNPGQVQRYRFPAGIIGRLMALRWWDWPDAVVDRYIPLLLAADIEEFLTSAEAEFGVSEPRPPAPIADPVVAAPRRIWSRPWWRRA